MKVYIYTLAILLTTLLTVSCGSNIDPHRNIAIARGAITDGDYNTALSALDEAGSVMTTQHRRLPYLPKRPPSTA